jgi:hypothetical protein
MRAYYLNPEFHTLSVMCAERNFYVSEVKFRPFMKTAFQLRSKVRDQNKTGTPHVCCIMCLRPLTDWLCGSQMPSPIPIIWNPEILLNGLLFLLNEYYLQVSVRVARFQK